MNRRELLKFSLLSPLLGLFKSRTGLTMDKLLECRDELEKHGRLLDENSEAMIEIPMTTGTSSEGAVGYYDGVWIHLHEVKAAEKFAKGIMYAIV